MASERPPGDESVCLHPDGSTPLPAARKGAGAATHAVPQVTVGKLPAVLAASLEKQGIGFLGLPWQRTTRRAV